MYSFSRVSNDMFLLAPGGHEALSVMGSPTVTQHQQTSEHLLPCPQYRAPKVLLAYVDQAGEVLFEQQPWFH